MKLHPLSKFEYHFLAGGLFSLAAIILFVIGNPGIALIFGCSGYVNLVWGLKDRNSQKK